MTQSTSPTTTPGTGRPQPTGQPQPAGGPIVQRQFVNFAFYKLDPAFRRLNDHEKIQARSEFLCLFQSPRPGLICLSYSTVGLRPDVDFLLWRIGLSPDEFQSQTQLINKSRLGAYLTTPHSLVSMTKRSMYIDKLDPFHTVESRTHIIPGKRKYLFVYPFVKTRDWYLLPLPERQEIMDGHIKVGNKYPSVKLNTTYSFGLDDQDFVVAFESDEPKDFLDLVMELRETQSSKYTQRDTPIFTCVQMPMENVLDQLF
ncbi:MAG: chlorite dismutase [Phycisphaerales bacterium]|jgi:chlorite dismutase|nr:chlorite dismutase [Phycisphaerales bacterium]MDB5355557.1 chlorite dismutase [Phycisphaerales bacterium]